MKARSASPAAGLIRRPFLGMSLALGVAVALAAGVPSAHAAARASATAASGLRVPAAARPAGTWRLLPRAPVGAMPNPQFTVSVWTGRQMIIHSTFGGFPAANGRVTLAYRPGTNTWAKLAPGPACHPVESIAVAVWTGSQMLVIGQTFAAYGPATNTWRRISGPGGPASNVLGWTGRQVLMWIDGCCGGGSNQAASYNPRTNAWKLLPTAPLQRRFGAEGAWTGKELVVAGGVGERSSILVFRNGAAYSPVTGRWHAIAPMPRREVGATAVWDGREILFIGGFRAGTRGPAPRGLAYNPVTNRWRLLPAMAFPRFGFAAVWTGRQLLVWGGVTASGTPPPHGEAYTPASNTWTALPTSPLRGRLDPVAVWTGRQMIVWGGHSNTTPSRAFTDGAVYTPAQ
jgi:hypothetical protein